MSRSKGDLNPKVLTILALLEQNSPLIVIAIHVIHKLNCWILMLHCCYLTKHRNTQRKKIYRAQFYFKRFKPYIVITKLETPHCSPFYFCQDGEPGFLETGLRLLQWHQYRTGSPHTTIFIPMFQTGKHSLKETFFTSCSTEQEAWTITVF